MADQDSNKQIRTNQLTQKFILDRNESFTDDQTLGYHKNGMFQTIKSTEIFSVNEPSNLKCIELPYKYLGHVQLPGEHRHLIFSGDEDNSEIGIADTLQCKYTKVANNPCFNFSKHNNPITGAVRINQDKEEEIIFVDGGNPDRFINLSKIPYTYEIDEYTNCKEKVYTGTIDCEELLLDPKLDFPVIEITLGGSGNLPDGVYSVHIAYLVNDQRFSDYMCTSVPIIVNNAVAGTNSITLNISNLDRDFDKYQVLLTGVVKGQRTSKIIGKYPTSQSFVAITDWVNDEYEEGVTTDEILVHKRIYNSTGILASNSEYLLRADVTRKPEINYQPQAFNIKTSYVIKQVPLDYYKNGGEDIGYFRNENYNFVIRWYWNDGEPTKHAQIAGREKQARDKMQAVGKDVFENDKTVKTLKTQTNIEYWRAFNTAGYLQNLPYDKDQDERIIGFGSTGYSESTDNYPEDEKNPMTGEKNIIFGNNACTPIRYHRMPDEERVPRYVDIDGQMYINIIGVKFENIEHPKDENGNYIQGITHYEILRSERDEANSTVVARGIVTNMGEFKDEKGTITAYSNFPFNSMQPNTFLSSSQTFKKHDREFNFKPLTKFYRNRFTFYTPHGNYFGRKSLASTYINFETEEWGEATGYFEEPYKHPKHKMLTNYAFYIAACIGVVEALSMVMGNRTATVNQSQMPWDVVGLSIGSFNAGTSTTVGSLYPTLSTTSDENRLSFPRFYSDLKNTPAVLVPVKFLINTIKLLIALGGFVLEAAKFVTEVIETIRNFSEEVQYARQYNGEVFYNKQNRIQRGYRRRAFEKQPFYLDGGIHSSGGIRINNGGRNSGIYLHVKGNIIDPKVVDESRFTMGEAKLRAKSKERVTKPSSVYYVTIMKNNLNQYGTIEGVKPVKIHTNPIQVKLNTRREVNMYESPVMFGGDCIIAEQTHLNRMPLFRQDLTNTEFDYTTPFDYRIYNNVGYPRFWIDSTDYEVGNMMSIIGKNQPDLAKLPNQKYNMDIPNFKKNEFIEKDQVFYTSINGVLRYIVEVPYNIAYRSAKGEGEGNSLYSPHFSDEQHDLSYIFRSDMKAKKENFQLDSSYAQISQVLVSSEQLVKIPKAPVRENNTVLYSLPATQAQSYNNWRYFLPLNRWSFEERDFGFLTGVHALDQDRIAFLFSKASPFILPGRDQLQAVSGRKITIGDGGLFAVPPREIMKTAVGYGSNHDRYAFNSNQFGHFYVSEQQGKLFNFTGDLDEFSRNGWHKWCGNFVPLQLKRQFPNYKGIHNPLSGVGYQIIFDNFYETVYFCKKDFYAGDGVTYDERNNQFISPTGRRIDLGDPEFFEDCSMTLSYNPSMESFVSFHDWHPDGVIQEERHFLTAKDNTLWKHNERFDSFCNYYGKDYPYQLGLTISTGQTTTTLQSIELIQDAYIYKTNGLDRYATFNETFDWAMVYNQEQLSGMLNLIPSTDERYSFKKFPEFINDYQVKIPIKKAEGKWRFNMFYDYTKDRGRLENYDKQPFVTQKNGYDFIINKPYLDFKIDKRPPRFRNIWHSVWFSRENCGNIQFITKFTNSQLIVSPR